MHGNSCGCTHCQPARAPVLEAEAGFRLPLPLQAFKPRCQPFLPAKPSKNYEDYVAAPTTGRITLMINGRNSGAAGPDINVAEAFDSMQQVVESLKKNDTLYLAAWQFDPTVPLTLVRAAGPKTWGLLLQKKAREGVKIRIIMTDFAPIATTLRAKVYQDFLPALDKLIGQLSPALRDNLKYLVSRHPATQYTIHVATHHQKFMVVKKSGATIAFCGGLDISYLRTPAYWNTPSYPWLWHDLHARLEGRIARDLEFEFIQRWNREKSASVVKALKGWRAFDTLTQGAAGALDRTPANNTQQLQMLRTVSFQGAGRSIQSIKRDDIWQAYLRLIGCASRFIFLENQYFREPRMADAIVRQAKLHPQLIVIVIVPEQLDDPDDPIKRHGNWLQHAFFTRLFAGIAPNRLRVFTMFHRIIHSKLILVDDQVLCMGSANANPRGFFLDTELNVVLDDVDGVTQFRQRLWAHELGVPDTTVATWKVADFIARWDAVANANQRIKKRPDDVAGEGVIPFDPRREKGQKQPRIADVLTETEALGSPSWERDMHQKHCHCSACAGGFEVMAFAPQGGAELFDEAEALALVDELFAMENEEDLDLFLGKLTKSVGRAASGAARAVGKAAKSIPLGKIADVAFKVARGDLAGLMLPLLPASMQKTVRAFSTDPFARFALQTTRAALRGENVLRAAQVAAKSGIENIQERMKFAAMVAPFVPGIGSGVAAALGAASALAAGEPITKAILAAARSAVPGGAIAQAAFDMGVNLAKGKSLGEAALATARNQLPGGPAAKAAFDAAVALGQGKKIQDAAFAAAGSVLPKSPYASGAMAFARRVAAGEDLRRAALSTAGNAVLGRLEKQGVKVLGAAQQRAVRSAGAAVRKEREFGEFGEFGAPGAFGAFGAFEQEAGDAGQSGRIDRMRQRRADGVWLRRGRHVVLYGV